MKKSSQFFPITIDEVGAIVGDIGSTTSRFGSSGWDSPKNIFSTVSSSSSNHLDFLLFISSD
jgi:actin-related protein